MRNSRNPIEKQRTLDGYLVVWKSEGVTLTANYGPTLNGRGWNLDWSRRSTVFKSLAAAQMVVRMFNHKCKCRVVPLKKLAVLVPDVDSRFRVYFRAELKERVTTIESQVSALLNHAKYHEDRIKSSRAEAQRYRKMADALIKHQKQKGKKKR